MTIENLKMLRKIKGISSKQEPLDEGQVTQLTNKTEFTAEQIRKSHRDFMADNPNGNNLLLS